MEQLVATIREQLRDQADPERAPGQQAYMKSALPFWGVRVPEVRRLTKAAAKGITDADTLYTAAQTLWTEATHREEKYAAMALISTRVTAGDPASVLLIEHMVRTGQWWDITDELSHRLGVLLDHDPEHMAALMRQWSTDQNLWIRRIAIISQLGRGERLDKKLLADAVESNSEDSDFFIRKGIGWALRDAAREHPEWVRSFVATHELSPLSVREALKNL